MESHGKAQTKTDELLDTLDWIVWLGRVCKEYVDRLGLDDAPRHPGRARLRHEMQALNINKKKVAGARPLPLLSQLLALAKIIQGQITECADAHSKPRPAAQIRSGHPLAHISLTPRILAQRPISAARPRAGAAPT